MPKEITKIYFLKLELLDGVGKQLSSNFYWLSSSGDEKADFTDLNMLPKTYIGVTYSQVQTDSLKCRFTVTIENPGPVLAFALNPKILNLTTREPVLPVKWDDNYFSLLPYEKRVLKVEFDLKDTVDNRFILKVDGWNLNTVEMEVR
jgi:exo-1,4-beta-D-glucosaminidase